MSGKGLVQGQNVSKSNKKPNLIVMMNHVTNTLRRE